MVDVATYTNPYQVARAVEELPHVLIADVLNAIVGYEYDIIAIAEIADDQLADQVAAQLRNRAEQLEGVVDTDIVWTRSSRQLAPVVATPVNQQEEDDDDVQ